MSKECLEFLRNSFLFHRELAHCSYSDAELFLELQKYRDYVMSNIEEIRGEIRKENEKLNICVETFSELPATNLYKQLIMYMDQVVIPDPLFEQTEGHSVSNDVMGELIGFKQEEGFDREKLYDAIEYIKYIAPMIDNNFVVMLPLSLMHEMPKEILITYSPTAFADVLPQEILEYYWSLADIRNFEKCKTGLQIKRDEPLKIGNGIYIRFSDEDSAASIYQYVQTKVFDFDEKTGSAKIGYRSADIISEEEFRAWVSQSTNQAANHHFMDRYNELVFAQRSGCMYLSQSALTAKILNMIFERPAKEAELATMALQMELPVIDQIPISDLLSIRKNYGEAFHNFRVELNARLLSLDMIEDSVKMSQQLNSISYDLNNIQIKEVEKEYRKIMRTLKLDAIALSGSLVASFATGGLTAVGAAAAFVKGISDVNKYFTDVNEHNGFFLWKLNKQAQKYTV